MLRITRVFMALFLFLVFTGISTAHEPAQIRTLPAEAFKPVILSERPSIPETSLIIKEPIRRVLPERKDTKPVNPSAKIEGKIAGQDQPVRGILRGKASWYCNYDNPRFDWSICHYKYPDNAGPDLYAAACGKLRKAIGSKWRNDIVTVRNLRNDKKVKVRLVDWCGSTDKTIDLYQDAMGRIGATWTAQVEIVWK